MKLKYTLLALAAVTGVASAATISVNFHEDNGQAHQILGAAEVAGATGYAEDNWNNLTYADGAGPAASGPSIVNDDSGIATTAAVTWAAGGAWGDSTANTDAINGVSNAKLQRGYLDDQNDGVIDVTVTGVPYANYTVVLYYSSDQTSGTHHATTVNGVASASGGAIQSWGAAPSLDIGRNVIVVTGQTSSTLTLDGLPLNAPTSRGSLSGLQIVEVPEPSSAALLGLGGLALMLRRRK